MDDEPWQRLRAEYEADQIERVGEPHHRSRHVVFEDGTVWFPDVGPDGGGSLLLPVMFGALLLSAVAVAVGWHDGLQLVTGVGAAGVLLAVALIAVVVRGANRREAAAEARLARGLFLFADRAVWRDAGTERAVPRAEVREVRTARGGQGAQHEVIHFVLADEKIPVDLPGPAFPVIQAWHKRDLADAGRRA